MAFERALMVMLIITSFAFAEALVPKPSSPGAKNAEEDKKWNAPVPPVADKPEQWQKLIPELLNHGMPYGALAASRNMLNFFSDLASKELAYKTVIQLVELGYSGPTRPMFIPGDIEPPASTEFGRNYFFYKALADRDKNMNHWAQSQFEKVDKDNFPKYVFYQGVQTYNAGRIDDAIAFMKRALAITKGPQNQSLARREARTLARFYYEKEDFEKSLEIYTTFLLKTNPVTPTDWLEAAWSLYRLKRFPEALGYTYNFESKSAGATTVLDQYILRALIYREYCAVGSMAKLSKDFDEKYGKLLDRIKLGQPLAPSPLYVKIEHPETAEYRQAVRFAEELENEKSNISALPSDLKDLADYLYSSESKMLVRRRQSLENEALQVLAKYLVIMGESLRFLRFEVVRGKYDPERVFASEKPAEVVLVDNLDEETFRLHWIQTADYWSDERANYLGILKYKCDN